jgi:hypothetical protein
MNRRNFLSTMLYGLAASVAVRKFPFSVYSFPKEIKPLNVVPAVPKEIVELWKKRLEMVKRFGTDAGGEWWMHPKQLAALKQLGFGLPRIELHKIGDSSSFYSPDLYPSSTLFDIPIRECPYFRPDAQPVLMAPDFARPTLVPDVPHLYPLTPESFPYRRPEPSRL